MIIYSEDIVFAAEKLAFRYLGNWEKKHPELATEFDCSKLIDVRQKLFRRAFHPKAVVKLTKRLLDRGHKIVPGKNPKRRLSVQRHIDRFTRGLSHTIAAASDRLEKAGW